MSRSISTIAREIYSSWKTLSPYAAPYLDAMLSLSSINDSYYLDSGKGIVARFLSNATGWRGEDARRIKAELKALL